MNPHSYRLGTTHTQSRYFLHELSFWSFYSTPFRQSFVNLNKRLIVFLGYFFHFL
ncbi:hypothetical protein 2204_scaffold211_00028 [Bacteriophage sp.]|nr:hypothetical protein 2204_scaffold211_00028 [Bacteriophage sp.]